ncbi:MAG: alkane 1-monooxygenase [Bacteroidetes bacterium]|nr:alkane 1-monooxygenase [Bacteroidota bacterium]
MTNRIVTRILVYVILHKTPSMYFNRIKYLVAFVPHVGVLQAVLFDGIFTWMSMIYLLLLLPIIEILFGQNKSNLDENKIERVSHERWYDFLLFIMVPIQYGLLFYFLYHISFHEMTTFEYIGNITSMGVLSGTIGINVAHELGHRSTALEKFLSKALLLTSGYLHFFIEHNRGHHKKVSTREDPASARYGETLYFFWMRSIVTSYISAWRIENERLRKIGSSIFSLKNEMIQFQIVQLIFIGIVFAIFDVNGIIGYLGCSLTGILLLESVNYMQHYGLTRKLKEDGKTYEQVVPAHSWNSAYPVGRILLFELGRHSDHHYKTSKKYQVLKHKEDSPQMPTGYTGMMTLALLPPIWFWIMNPLVEKYSSRIAV